MTRDDFRIDDGGRLLPQGEIQSAIPIHDIHGKRRLGAFYTPTRLTEILCDWGVSAPTQRILEPCFGGCTFLDSAILRLKHVGQSNPARNLFGCDIDPVAFKHLAERLGGDWSPAHFLETDFLDIEPKAFGSTGFDATIGNPPYIRHSQFNDAQKEVVSRWRDRNPIEIDKKAGLWAYFLLHVLSFLKPGARIAWVLPGSFITSQYSAAIREYVAARFEKTLAICLAERLFLSEGTEERSVVLLADTYSKPAVRQMHVSHCHDVQDIKKDIASWSRNSANFDVLGLNANESVVPPRVREVMQCIALNPAVKKFSDLARIKIGLVTGNNKFFIKSASAWKEIGISERNLHPIVPRIAWLSGIVLSTAYMRSIVDEDAPCLILDTSHGHWSKALVAFLESYPGDIESNATFAKRDNWHYPLDAQTPHAFLAYITHFGPRLVLNHAKVNATNSVYRVYFNKGLSQKIHKIAAISIHTTFSQLWAEAVGRACGAGGLKLEPSEVMQLPIPIPSQLSSSQVEKALTAINGHLKANDYEKARKLADRLIFSHMGADAVASISELEAGLTVARSRRMRQAV